MKRLLIALVLCGNLCASEQENLNNARVASGTKGFFKGYFGTKALIYGAVCVATPATFPLWGPLAPLIIPAVVAGTFTLSDPVAIGVGAATGAWAAASVKKAEEKKP